jgi:hypothetical protein
VTTPDHLHVFQRYVLATIVECIDINKLRKLQLELWIALEDEKVGGSRDECRRIANSMIEYGMRQLAEKITGQVDIPFDHDPRELLDQVREVMSSREA